MKHTHRLTLLALVVLAIVAVAWQFRVRESASGAPKVDRELPIRAPESVVFDKIADVRTYATWSPWSAPGLSLLGERDVEGHPGFDWKGPGVERGTVALVERNERAYRVDYLETSGETSSRGEIQIIESKDGRTVVRWLVTGEGGTRVAGQEGPEATTAAVEAALARLKKTIEAEEGTENDGDDVPEPRAR